MKPNPEEILPDKPEKRLCDRATAAFARWSPKKQMKIPLVNGKRRRAPVGAVLSKKRKRRRCGGQ